MGVYGFGWPGASSQAARDVQFSARESTKLIQLHRFRRSLFTKLPPPHSTTISGALLGCFCTPRPTHSFPSSASVLSTHHPDFRRENFHQLLFLLFCRDFFSVFCLVFSTHFWLTYRRCLAMRQHT